MKIRTEEALKKLSASLDIKRKVVGVKFLFTETDYDNCNTPEAKSKMAYCVMVKLASKGICIKANKDLFGCGGGTRALGLEAPTENFKSGCEYNDFGIYENLAISKNVVNNITFCKHKIYGVQIQPLEAFENEEPDVVILITNCYNAMRIVQGHTYKFGTQSNFKLTGNQAVCSECTAYPFESNSINLSMFCSGTRYLAGWEENEMCIGITFEKFISTCDGIYNSINGAETNQRKEKIIKLIEENELSNPGIHTDDAYFIRYERSKKKDN